MTSKYFKKVYCNNSEDEIKKLEAEFRKAYVMKALDAQIAEKNADKIAELARDKLSEKLLNINLQKAVDIDFEIKLKKIDDNKKYKEYLEDQISEEKKKKIYNDEQLRQERQVLEKVDKIMDEEYEIERKNNREFMVNKLRREQLIFQEIKFIKKCIENEKEKLELEKNKNYISEMEARCEEIKKINKQREKNRQIIIEKVAKLFVDARYLREERNALILDLITEDVKHELMLEEKNLKVEKKLKEKNLANDLLEQIYLSVESERIFHERDDNFVVEVMKKMMEDERHVKLTIEARRRKRMDYQKDLESIIDERRKLREKSLAKLKEELKDNHDIELIRLERIKEERRKLIKKHSANVENYFKSCVLSKEEEKLFHESSSKF